MKQIINKNRAYFIPFLLWILSGLACILFIKSENLFFFFNRHLASPLMDYMMFITTQFGRGDVILIIGLLGFSFPALRNKHYFFLASLTGMMAILASQFLKFLFDSPRPVSVYSLENVRIISWVKPLYHYSLPSGHTLGAFTLFTFASLLLLNKNKYIGTIFFILALLAGVSRIYLGQHFFLDVYLGSLIGTGMTLLLYFLYTKYFSSPVRPRSNNE